MGKFLLAVLIGLVGAVLVHIAVIGAMPEVASNNAWGRLTELGKMYDVVRVEPLETEGRLAAAAGTPLQHGTFAFADPAFVTASCRFSLAKGPVRLSADSDSTTFWSASIYNSQGDNLYSINDRAAVGDTFDLLVGTRDQIIDVQADTDPQDDEDTTIPVEVEMGEGYMTIRALVDEESKRPAVNQFIQSLQCAPASAETAQGMHLRQG
ncbi:DUF1254 domain-containing protein [Aurantimonas sp. VKM B-3413]|uniref:DUF1254 domain-containing protein n=1 Tax=Aurantimonas sp. VKM B-3413 TaxID=2779401 RepID=UPI001E409E4D|nr:DUF1254 domain-containing protein [Aurantimonas sp. VKM B-3413]MCB8838269.1 hypothetical protein [Aurantimonas sp. VKM B-3413]